MWRQIYSSMIHIVKSEQGAAFLRLFRSTVTYLRATVCSYETYAICLWRGQYIRYYVGRKDVWALLKAKTRRLMPKRRATGQAGGLRVIIHASFSLYGGNEAQLWNVAYFISFIFIFVLWDVSVHHGCRFLWFEIDQKRVSQINGQARLKFGMECFKIGSMWLYREKASQG